VLGTLVFTTQAFVTEAMRLVVFLPDPVTARALHRTGRAPKRR